MYKVYKINIWLYSVFKVGLVRAVLQFIAIWWYWLHLHYILVFGTKYCSLGERMYSKTMLTIWPFLASKTMTVIYELTSAQLSLAHGVTKNNLLECSKLGQNLISGLVIVCRFSRLRQVKLRNSVSIIVYQRKKGILRASRMHGVTTTNGWST